MTPTPNGQFAHSSSVKTLRGQAVRDVRNLVLWVQRFSGQCYVSLGVRRGSDAKLGRCRVEMDKGTWIRKW